MARKPKPWVIRVGRWRLPVTDFWAEVLIDLGVRDERNRTLPKERQDAA